jgi:hypothetical protein
MSFRMVFPSCIRLGLPAMGHQSDTHSSLLPKPGSLLPGWVALGSLLTGCFTYLNRQSRLAETGLLALVKTNNSAQRLRVTRFLIPQGSHCFFRINPLREYATFIQSLVDLSLSSRPSGTIVYRYEVSYHRCISYVRFQSNIWDNLSRFWRHNPLVWLGVLSYFLPFVTTGLCSWLVIVTYGKYNCYSRGLMLFFGDVRTSKPFMDGRSIIGSLSPWYYQLWIIYHKQRGLWSQSLINAWGPGSKQEIALRNLVSKNLKGVATCMINKRERHNTFGQNCNWEIYVQLIMFIFKLKVEN